jgi:hypothetical protein
LILDKIGKLIDPRGSRSDKFTTYDIYSLANQFIQERGMNAEELTLHLNELNEKDKERKEIKRAIKKEYYDYMEVMVRTNKLAIRQPTISKPQIRKVERLRNLESTYQSVYEESKDVTPLNSLNHSKSLKKLKSLSSLDELGQFNSE